MKWKWEENEMKMKWNKMKWYEMKNEMKNEMKMNEKMNEMKWKLFRDYNRYKPY